jgi:hypothetical protein
VTEQGNAYLDQVVAKQERLASDLRSRRSLAPSAAAPAPPPGGPFQPPSAPVTNAVEVRVTGFGRWKTVIVPPNAFVVHTRRGYEAPLDVGLGVSFRYNPATDSFLVVPGAMQTILIDAYCICSELQGVLVQAYVQWIIQDFGIAYKKLDFGDAAEPMRLVNLQLKEQAEAAVKDKVSTMSVRDVLSDKQPIIEELTARLRAVAEGEGDSDQGLGLRIVTVQIKEAVVSSKRVWENLQKPYRSEQNRIARLAELASEQAIHQREVEAAGVRETQSIESERGLAEIRARNAAAAYDRDAAEKVRRERREQEDTRTLAELQNETMLHGLELERASGDVEAELARLRTEREFELKRLTLEGELAMVALRTRADHDRALLALDLERAKAVIANEQSPAAIQARLVELLPEIMRQLPKPAEVRSVSINGTDSSTLTGLLAELAAVLSTVRG